MGSIELLSLTLRHVRPWVPGATSVGMVSLPWPIEVRLNTTVKSRDTTSSLDSSSAARLNIRGGFALWRLGLHLLQSTSERRRYGTQRHHPSGRHAAEDCGWVSSTPEVQCVAGIVPRAAASSVDLNHTALPSPLRRHKQGSERRTIKWRTKRAPIDT